MDAYSDADSAAYMDAFAYAIPTAAVADNHNDAHEHARPAAHYIGTAGTAAD